MGQNTNCTWSFYMSLEILKKICNSGMLHWLRPITCQDSLFSTFRGTTAEMFQKQRLYLSKTGFSIYKNRANNTSTGCC